MKLELSDLNNGAVFIGDKLLIQTKFILEEASAILWSGIRLFTKPPCKKEFQINKAEIFSMGEFEAGEYIRERSLLIRNNVVPTIRKRNLEYNVQLILRMHNPINPDDDLIVKKNHPIVIQQKNQATLKTPNPIQLSLSGLNVKLTKDIFKPGETIKITYRSENFKEIEVRLLQKANLICYCETYGKKCINIEELPPSIAGDVKTSNTKEGFMLLKVPVMAESSHNYLWEPSEKEYWGIKYGDYSEWTLLILGKKSLEYGRVPIQFEVPITISTQRLIEGPLELDLFSEQDTGSSKFFEELPSKLQKRFEIISISKEGENRYKTKIKNISYEELQGITVKLRGLQEGLFETAPFFKGFNLWLPNEEKEIVYKSLQNISSIIITIEDNSQRSVRIQTSI